MYAAINLSMSWRNLSFKEFALFSSFYFDLIYFETRLIHALGYNFGSKIQSLN